MGFGPHVVDLNQDGHLDIVSGSWPGTIYLFEGEGDQKFAERKVLIDKLERSDEYKKYGYSLLQAGAVAAADWDGDEDADLIVGTIFGKLYFLENKGMTEAGAYDFKKPVLLADGRFGDVRWSKAGPHVTDWDRDGDLDLIVGVETGGLYLLMNNGTKKKPKFGKPKPILFAGKPFEKGYYRLKPCLADWNEDGVLDLLVGSTLSQENAEGERSVHGYVWLSLGKRAGKK